VLRALKDDKGLILFPEGTRSPDGRLKAPKAGVGLIACRSQVPVVPARVFGSFEAYGKGRSLRLGTPVTVVFGRPVLPSAYDQPDAGRERYQIASERIMAEIARLEPPPTVTL
jgi:1-acyl-sn-glycerol-3-phosphate acyltransferase